MKTELGVHLGARARIARNRLGLTQADAGRQLGLAREVYARLERGQMLPSLTTLRGLCRVLRVPPHELLALDESFEPTSARRRPARNTAEPPKLRELRKTLQGLSRSDLKLLNVLAAAMPAGASSKRRR